MFSQSRFSYRELPLRWAELEIVYRDERSGTLHGLIRAGNLPIDDAHIFCLPNLQSVINSKIVL
ncbi:aminoacyl--tRNA ligase-related protein [Nostoc sp.]|uniref:aminoacyl--tRNA ligase-related protein n=1 Tax=Nostoc sp. TaxID=1180 RepID=UPI002FF542A3